MEIYARSLDVVVSQKLLNGAKVGSLLQQVSGKGVAEYVYVYPVSDAGSIGGFLQHFHQCACLILFSGGIALE